jgi:hypothetical protein
MPAVVTTARTMGKTAHNPRIAAKPVKGTSKPPSHKLPGPAGDEEDWTEF